MAGHEATLSAKRASIVLGLKVYCLGFRESKGPFLEVSWRVVRIVAFRVRVLEGHEDFINTLIMRMLGDIRCLEGAINYLLSPPNPASTSKLLRLGLRVRKLEVTMTDRTSGF